jgi:hypothetical protein
MGHLHMAFAPSSILRRIQHGDEVASRAARPIIQADSALSNSSIDFFCLSCIFDHIALFIFLCFLQYIFFDKISGKAWEKINSKNAHYL